MPKEGRRGGLIKESYEVDQVIAEMIREVAEKLQEAHTVTREIASTVVKERSRHEQRPGK